MRTPLVALGALIFLSACAGPRPAPPDLAVPTPGQWRLGLDVAAGPDLSERGWSAFGDAGLTATVQEALANNLDLALAAARVEEARAQFNAADAQKGPNLNGAGGGARQRAVNAFGQPTEQTVSQTQLSIAYDADLFGRLRHATAASRANLLAARANQDAVRLAIAATAANGYIGVVALKARLSVLRQTIAARQAALALAQRRVGAGYAPTLDLRQAQVELAAAEQAIPAIDLALARQENGLRLLLGRADGPLPTGADLQTMSVPSLPAGLPASLLRRRPDLAAAEDQVVAADETLKSARAAFMPSLQLTATAGQIDSTLLNNPVGVFSVGGSVLAPLFDSGRLAAQRDIAAARRQQAALNYRRAALTAFREVEDGLAAVEANDRQEVALSRQLTAAADALRLASNRYRAGYSPFLEQIDAQRGLLASELALVQARSDRLTARVTLYQALGGGWAQRATP